MKPTWQKKRRRNKEAKNREESSEQPDHAFVAAVLTTRKDKALLARFKTLDERTIRRVIRAVMRTGTHKHRIYGGIGVKNAAEFPLYPPLPFSSDATTELTFSRQLMGCVPQPNLQADMMAYSLALATNRLTVARAILDNMTMEYGVSVWRLREERVLDHLCDVEVVDNHFTGDILADAVSNLTPELLSFPDSEFRKMLSRKKSERLMGVLGFQLGLPIPSWHKDDPTFLAVLAWFSTRTNQIDLWDFFLNMEAEGLIEPGMFSQELDRFWVELLSKPKSPGGVLDVIVELMDSLHCSVEKVGAIVDRLSILTRGSLISLDVRQLRRAIFEQKQPRFSSGFQFWLKSSHSISGGFAGSVNGNSVIHSQNRIQLALDHQEWDSAALEAVYLFLGDPNFLHPSWIVELEVNRPGVFLKPQWALFELIAPSIDFASLETSVSATMRKILHKSRFPSVDHLWLALQNEVSEDLLVPIVTRCLLPDVLLRLIQMNTNTQHLLARLNLLKRCQGLPSIIGGLDQEIDLLNKTLTQVQVVTGRARFGVNRLQVLKEIEADEEFQRISERLMMFSISDEHLESVPIAKQLKRDLPTARELYRHHVFDKFLNIYLHGYGGLNFFLSMRVRHGALEKKIIKPFADAGLNYESCNEFPGISIENLRAIRESCSNNLAALVIIYRSKFTNIHTRDSEFNESLLDFEFTRTQLDGLFKDQSFSEVRDLTGCLFKHIDSRRLAIARQIKNEAHQSLKHALLERIEIVSAELANAGMPHSDVGKLRSIVSADVVEICRQIGLWFTTVEEIYSQDACELTQLLELACDDAEFATTLPTTSNVLVPSNQAPFLVDALELLITNARRHGTGLVEVEFVGNSLMISNPLLQFDAELSKRLNATMERPNRDKFGCEGGSGTSKLARVLQDVPCVTNCFFRINDCRLTFYAELDVCQ